jgi:hypothetical protein
MRALITAGVIAALAVPAAAGAITTDTGGRSADVFHAKRNFPFQFIAASRHGTIVKVRRFRFSNVPMTCDGPTQATVSNRGNPLPTMTVRQNRFHGSFDVVGGSQHITIKGRFRGNGRRVGGVLRVRGDFPDSEPPLTNCDTGKTPFRGALSG